MACGCGFQGFPVLAGWYKFLCGLCISATLREKNQITLKLTYQADEENTLCGTLGLCPCLLRIG